MQTFNATYYWNGAMGAFETIECIVTANTQSEALGLVLTEFPETEAEFWTMYEHDTTKPHVDLVCRAEN